MNLKLVTIGSMVSLLLAISASGQKQTTMQQVILQDDRSADHLLIIIPTGEYKFQSCNGNISVSGVGKVTVTGCTVTLQDVSETKRALAELDLCTREGKADIAFESDGFGSGFDRPEFDIILADSNTADSAFSCGPQ